MEKENKVVGILGGMGPRATVSFLDKIISLTPAKKDWEHLHVVVDNNTKIPSRTRHYLFKEESPVPRIIESCKKLESWPVDFIAMPCNSANFFLPDIQPEIRVPILNIMKITANNLKKLSPKINRTAVIGGRITYAERTYQKYLEEIGIEYIHHDEELQKRIEDAIEHIKVGQDEKKSYEEWENIKSELTNRYNAEAIIMGCTEFGCIYDGINPDTQEIPVVDSSTELAKEIVKIVKKHE